MINFHQLNHSGDCTSTDHDNDNHHYVNEMYPWLTENAFPWVDLFNLKEQNADTQMNSDQLYFDRLHKDRF